MNIFDIIIHAAKVDEKPEISKQGYQYFFVLFPDGFANF
jgi:hypothetical protein